ncbi:MAG TPA: 16S rRNA (adenine(1518)-N(6)/adenine(1519)-N(6))-dimethyltransferase RsmA [Terriglobales bacterium]|nr:16S rRNA (adenine(1518)-N(6)/adenine(1519)-N(6))-dimethyltransferase RsmA [Terriglobales bacterium]
MSAHRQVNAARRSSRPRKAKLGQNFLIDTTAARRIVESLGDISNSVVIEIGPGRGALTKILADRAALLIAIELDAQLARQWRETFRGMQNVEILQANFLDVSLSELLKAHPQASHSCARVVGNIPYYITSDILLRLFEQHELIDTIVLMLQKEVADRLMAEPGSRDYGLLTVTARLFADVERLFTLAPGAFSPPPQVYSSVLRLRIAPKAERLNVDAQEFLSFCKLAFAQKRKTLFNNLRGRYEENEIKAALRSSKLREDVRAEAMSLENLAVTYKLLGSRGGAENPKH